MTNSIIILLTLVFVVLSAGRQGFGPTEQEWGYVTVREGAHMFWWLHETSANVTNYTERPLVIWLQGGPGASSTGYGNFAELGPLDVDLNPRNTTWIKDYNVLFVDNPVGTGFSYVENSSALVTNNSQIAQDFLVFIKGFYEAIPELLNTPLYIFCESYGGKMTPEIALVLDQAIKNGDLDVNLKGIGLGDSFVSPADFALSWGPYLLSVGAVDQNGFEKIQNLANATKDAIDKKDYILASFLFYLTREAIESETANIDFYNILKKVPIEKSLHLKKHNMGKFFVPSYKDEIDDKIAVIMNTQVKQALGLDFEWGSQHDNVYTALFFDILTGITDIVETLLNVTDIQVAVYNGQLDLVVDTPGVMAWIDRLHFKGLHEYETSPRNPIVVDGIVEGYYKKGGNLGVYWVDRAGHMVPADNPAAMSFILRDVIGDINKANF